MTLLRGVRDDCELLTWLTKYIFPLEARFVSPEFVRCGALLACWEMIASGTTTFADGYFFEEEVAKAADEAGLRVIPGQAILDVPTPDAKELGRGPRARGTVPFGVERASARHAGALPHACYTVGPDTFRRTHDLAARFGAPILTHLAESSGEVAVVRERYGTTPVRHLAALGLLDRLLTAAHGVAVDGEEIDLLARSGVGVVHCAESNMKLASGVAPVARMLSAGIAVGIGTDGPASNNDLDMFGEMGSVARFTRCTRSSRPRCPPGRSCGWQPWARPPRSTWNGKSVPWKPASGRT